MNKARQQNIELLRVVCMIFILLFHFNLNSILRNENTSETLNYIALFGNSIVVIAVNCFILISGYFGINIKLKTLTRLFVQTEFYSVIAVLLSALLFGISKGAVKSLMPFQPAGLWFIPLYFLLFVSAPLLNLIVEHKRLHKLSIVTIVTASFAAYFGGGIKGMIFLSL